MKRVINDKQNTKMNVFESQYFTIGNFTNGDIDIDDINNCQTNSFISPYTMFAHELGEQYIKQTLYEKASNEDKNNPEKFKQWCHVWGGNYMENYVSGATRIVNSDVGKLNNGTGTYSVDYLFNDITYTLILNINQRNVSTAEVKLK